MTAVSKAKKSVKSVKMVGWRRWLNGNGWVVRGVGKEGVNNVKSIPKNLNYPYYSIFLTLMKVVSKMSKVSRWWA